jgi:hypothetical protein
VYKCSSTFSVPGDKPEITPAVLPTFFQHFWDSNLKLGHDQLLPNSFQLIFHLSPFKSTLYTLGYLKKTSLSKLQINE